MSTPLPSGWKEVMVNNKVVYKCGRETTPNFPKIPCNIPEGWVHKLSKSTGKTYFSCPEGENGSGVTQWEQPSENCTGNIRKRGSSVPKGFATVIPSISPTTPLTTPPTTPRPALSPGFKGSGVLPLTQPKSNTEKAANAAATAAASKAATATAASTNAAVGAAVSQLAPNAATIHVTVQTPTGSEGYNVRPTAQAGGKNRHKKTRRNKNKNRKNKSKKNRKNKK